MSAQFLTLIGETKMEIKIREIDHLTGTKKKRETANSQLIKCGITLALKSS